MANCKHAQRRPGALVWVLHFATPFEVRLPYARANERLMWLRTGGAQWSQAAHDDSIAPEYYVYATPYFARQMAVKRSRNLHVARIDPIVQFMANPLLRHDVVDADGVWHGIP